MHDDESIKNIWDNRSKPLSEIFITFLDQVFISEQSFTPNFGQRIILLLSLQSL